MVKIFVGGFPLEMTELELVQLIAPYGDVITVKIVRDKKTKICKGYAFLEMTDRPAAKRVMEALDGTGLKDRILMVNIVEEKPVAAQPTYVKIAARPVTFKPKRPRR